MIQELHNMYTNIIIKENNQKLIFIFLEFRGREIEYYNQLQIKLNFCLARKKNVFKFILDFERRFINENLTYSGIFVYSLH